MKKNLLSIIIISLMFVTIFQSTISVNAKVSNSKKNVVSNLYYKDYRFCKLDCKGRWVFGSAFLFPGYGISLTGSPPVWGSSGIIVYYGSAYNLTGSLYINNEKLPENWKYAIVLLLIGGSFANRNGFPPVSPIFDVYGTALFVRVFYK